MRNAFQILVLLTAVFGLGLGAAFAGGVYWGQRDTPAATPTPAGAQAGATGGVGAAGAGIGAGFGAAAAQATTGVVEEISGDTVTVRTQAGGTVAVKMQSDTQVRQLAPAAVTDIKPGQTVVVQGQPDVDGKVAARSVQITGAGGQGAGAGGGGQGGQRPAGAPAGGQGQRVPGQTATPTAGQ
jgi:hypothetical protein